MPNGVDRDAATRFLAERYGNLAGPVEALAGGDWSRAFAFPLDGRLLVVRFGRHVEDYVKDRKAMTFASPALPVPAVLEIGEALGGYYAVSERHFGRFLESLDEAGWQTVLPALLRGLDALREIPAPGAGTDWADENVEASLGWHEWLLASLEDRPGERVSGWREKLRADPEAEAVFQAAERELRALLPYCPEARHLIHRDLINRNVLVSEDASRLVAVFDWGCSVAGDFLYDIAWLTFWSPWYPNLQALGFRQAVVAHYRSVGLVVEHFAERIAAYELHIGLTHLAYAAFTNRSEELQWIAQRTREVLS